MSHTGRFKALTLAGLISLGATACNGMPWDDLFPGSGDGEQPATTTAPPGTAAPTTAPPTTDAPTTGAPTTTAPPGSESSTTVAPTTAAPTTAAPTTAAPTTAAPTTAAPTTAAPTTAAPTTADPLAAQLNDVEMQIFQWTNELRADPAGEHARSEPIECPGHPTDPATGHPTAVPPLELSVPVSLEMSRDWAEQMAASGSFQHRSGDSMRSIFAELGIDTRSYGENIAWEGGYPAAEKAAVHFNGWVESAGHYCNMLGEGYTHIGVGYHEQNGRSWAVQNFFTTG